jgi:hypothetical protein
MNAAFGGVVSRPPVRYRTNMLPACCFGRLFGSSEKLAACHIHAWRELLRSQRRGGPYHPEGWTAGRDWGHVYDSIQTELEEVFGAYPWTAEYV